MTEEWKDGRVKDVIKGWVEGSMGDGQMDG